MTPGLCAKFVCRLNTSVLEILELVAMIMMVVAADPWLLLNATASHGWSTKRHVGRRSVETMAKHVHFLTLYTAVGETKNRGSIF